MAKGSYIGIGGVARKIKGGYVGVGGVARKVVKGYVGVGDVARLFYAAEAGLTLGTLPIGSVLLYGRYDGTELLWTVVDTQKKDDGYITVALSSTTALTTKAFDAKEPSNPNTNAAGYGYYRYRYSNLRQWLNSELATWYTPAHEYDIAPAYQTDAGFLNGFTAAELNCIVPAQIGTGISPADGDGIETVTDKMWLPSAKAMSCTSVQIDAEDDRVFEAFTTAASRKWGEAIYWLRTPEFSPIQRVYTIMYTDGNAYSGNPYQTNSVRPFCNLAASTPLVYDEANNRYQLA